MNSAELSERFKNFLADSQQYQEALLIVRQNSGGEIWLAGGFVYRNIAHILFGGESPECDLDFIVETIKNPVKVGGGWAVQDNRNGNPKLSKGDLSIDLNPIANFHSIKDRHLPPTIENYLKGVPLTIQSIIYVVNEGVLIGEVGMRSILNREIAVNDLENFLYSTNKKNLKGYDLLKEKAEQLGFKPILPASS